MRAMAAPCSIHSAYFRARHRPNRRVERREIQSALNSDTLELAAQRRTKPNAVRLGAGPPLSLRKLLGRIHQSNPDHVVSRDLDCARAAKQLHEYPNPVTRGLTGI